MKITGRQLVEEARRWIDIPFAHQGRSRWGVDCIGLIICVRDTLSPWPEGMQSSRKYKRNAVGDLLPGLEATCTRIQIPEPGAVALIAWPGQKPTDASHVGLITPDNLIHSYQAAGRVAETGYRGHWLRWTQSLWRLPGVEA